MTCHEEDKLSYYEEDNLSFLFHDMSWTHNLSSRYRRSCHCYWRCHGLSWFLPGNPRTMFKTYFSSRSLLGHTFEHNLSVVSTCFLFFICSKLFDHDFFFLRFVSVFTFCLMVCSTFFRIRFSFVFRSPFSILFPFVPFQYDFQVCFEFQFSFVPTIFKHLLL